MKINWAANPLRTVVELNDGDRWALREAMQEDLVSESDDAWMNQFHADLETALSETHVGDCTCVPCSCTKCHAEHYLGIDTMPGLGKHLAYKVDHAFRGDRTIDEAIAALANYDPQPESPMWDGKRELWDSCLPRWREEAAQAHTWLVAYRLRTQP